MCTLNLHSHFQFMFIDKSACGECSVIYLYSTRTTVAMVRCVVVTMLCVCVFIMSHPPLVESKQEVALEVRNRYYCSGWTVYNSSTSQCVCGNSLLDTISVALSTSLWVYTWKGVSVCLTMKTVQLLVTVFSLVAPLVLVLHHWSTSIMEL